MTGQQNDLDAVLAELDTLIDGRSDMSDAYVAATNSSSCGGAITRDATPYWRQVARHLRRGAHLADLLAGDPTPTPVPAASARTASDCPGGQYRLDVVTDDPDQPIGVVFYDTAPGVDPLQRASRLLAAYDEPDRYGDLYEHDGAGTAIYYDTIHADDQDGTR